MNEDQYTIAFDIVQRRPACPLLQRTYGATITNEQLSIFEESEWLLEPTDDIHLFQVTDSMLQSLKIAITRLKIATQLSSELPSLLQEALKRVSSELLKPLEVPEDPGPQPGLDDIIYVIVVRAGDDFFLMTRPHGEIGSWFDLENISDEILESVKSHPVIAERFPPSIVSATPRLISVWLPLPHPLIEYSAGNYSMFGFEFEDPNLGRLTWEGGVRPYESANSDTV